MGKIQQIIKQAKDESQHSLSLAGLSLSELPLEVLDLSHLEELNLSNNTLKNVPPGLGKLSKLKSLNLYGNRLTVIPDVIYNLVNLDTLVLTANPISAIDAGIASLVNLRGLNIAQTAISKIPPEIGLLRQLHTLNLGSPLGNGKIRSLPKELGHLSNLLVLYLGGNKIQKIPPEISSLTNLFILDLSGNTLEVFPEEITNLSQLQFLDMGGNMLYGYNKISHLPVGIKKLVHLRNLILSYNGLTSLPDEIFELEELETLNLRANKLTHLSDQILRLKSLKHICLDQNELTDLPARIGDLPALRFLDARENRITALPLSLRNANLRELNLAANNLPVPPEIIARTEEPLEIIHYFFKSLQGKFFHLNEAKLVVVGQGGVGKTSIIRMLIWDEYSERQSKTEGISINTWDISLPNVANDAGQAGFQLNVWDFGGQEIMHSTHQFFLTKRSLYLLVLDARLTQEENRVEYWLKIIQSFGGESPVLIVGNKIDQHPLDLDRTGLYKKYPNIIGIVETSAVADIGLEHLKSIIIEQVKQLPHVQDLLPESWFMVKAKLEGMRRKSNFITYDTYVELCARNEVDDEISQRTLLGFMHDLGVILHFQDDPRLETLGILNPQWVTSGVYKILNSHLLFQSKGLLDVCQLDEILDLPEYPRGKRLFVIDMMRKFELCFDIEPEKLFLVPDLLPKDEPFTGDWSSSLAFQYSYSVLPSSIMSRFIVKMKEFLHQPSTWRSGAILQKGGNIALVKADFEERTISIQVQGTLNTCRDFLALIRGTFDILHKSIVKLDVKQQVPHPQHPNLILDYDELIEFEREGIYEFPRKVDGKVITVNVREMLSGVDKEIQQLGKSQVNVTNYNVHLSDNARMEQVVFAKEIQESVNQVQKANIDHELKETLKELADAVEKMIAVLPSAEAHDVTDDLSRLITEATKQSPSRKWYSVSIDGLIKAAENVEKLGEPVINLSRKILSLLTAGTIR